MCAWAGGSLVSGLPRSLAPSVLNWRCFHSVPLAEPFNSYRLKAPRDRMWAKLGRREEVQFQRYASKALPDRAVESFGGTLHLHFQGQNKLPEVSPLLLHLLTSLLFLKQSEIPLKNVSHIKATSGIVSPLLSLFFF